MKLKTKKIKDFRGFRNLWKVSKPIIWILVLIILTSSVFALGIRPAKTTVSFEPDLEEGYIFNIVNNEKIPLDIKIRVEGSLKYFIELEEEEFSITEEEEFRPVRFKLNLPPTLTPGLNLGEIIVTERVNLEGTITANLELSHKVRVIAPYPAKYVELNIQLRMREKESDIITEVINSGSEKIDQLTTQIQVYDNKKKLKELKTAPISLEPTQTKQYYLTLNHSLLSEGEYDVFAQVNYDGEELEITRKLIAGEPTIQIINHDEFFLEKEINDLRIELKNRWNKEIEDISADVIVKRQGREVYAGKTVAFDLKGKEQKVIKTFLDLSELGIGEADLFITLNYNGKSETVQYKIDIVSQDVFEEKIKEVQVITLPGGTFTIIIILIMSLMIFGMLLLLLVPPLIKRFKGQKEPSTEYVKKPRPPPQAKQAEPSKKQIPDIPEDDIYLPEEK